MRIKSRKLAFERLNIPVLVGNKMQNEQIFRFFKFDHLFNFLYLKNNLLKVDVHSGERNMYFFSVDIIKNETVCYSPSLAVFILNF